MEEKWHHASFGENILLKIGIYQISKEAESWEESLKIIDIGLKIYISTPSFLQKWRQEDSIVA